MSLVLFRINMSGTLLLICFFISFCDISIAKQPRHYVDTQSSTNPRDYSDSDPGAYPTNKYEKANYQIVKGGKADAPKIDRKTREIFEYLYDSEMNKYQPKEKDVNELVSRIEEHQPTYVDLDAASGIGFGGHRPRTTKNINNNRMRQMENGLLNLLRSAKLEQHGEAICLQSPMLKQMLSMWKMVEGFVLPMARTLSTWDSDNKKPNTLGPDDDQASQTINNYDEPDYDDLKDTLLRRMLQLGYLDD